MKGNFNIFGKKFINGLSIFLFIWLLYLQTASASVTYSNGAIYVYGNNENFTSINNSISDSSLLENLGNKEWILKAPLIVNDTSTTIYINDSDVSWLKLVSLNNPNVSYIYIKGIAEISNTKITSWNTNNNKEAPISDSYRSYIYIYGSSARTNISRSNLSYLGYEYTSGHAGITYQSSKSGNIQDSIFMNNYRGLYLNIPGSMVVNNNTISNNRYEGIITYGNDMQITNNSIYANKRGLEIRNGYRNKIGNNIVRDNINYGIVLGYSSNQNSLSNNTVINNNIGIYINGGVNNDINYGIITNNIDKGIYLDSSSNGNYTNNILSGQGFGFYISNSMNNILKSNSIFEIKNDAVYLNGNKNAAYYNHSIDITNTVNNKPIYYYPNKNNYILSDLIDAGKIIIVNSNNINVRNINMADAGGILLIDDNSSSIIDSFFNNLTYAINSKNSDYINMSNNSIANMILTGINYSISNHIIIANNTISHTKSRGIQGSSSIDALIEYNNVSYTDDRGINLETIRDTVVRFNNVFNSTTPTVGGELIEAWGPNSYNISFIGNHAYNSAEDCLEFVHIKGGVIKDNIIDRCTGEGIDVYGYTGINQYSEYINIENNTITKSNRGIIITDSDNNTIYNNDIDQNYYGIYIENRYVGGRNTINNTLYGISPYDNFNDLRYDISDNTILYAGKRDEKFPIENTDRRIYTRNGITVISENYYLKNGYLNISIKLSDGKELWTSKKIPQSISMELYPKTNPTNFSVDSYDINSNNEVRSINFTIIAGLLDKIVVTNPINGELYYLINASDNTVIESQISSSSVEFITDLEIGKYLVTTLYEGPAPTPTPTPTPTPEDRYNISGYKINGTDNVNTGLSGWKIIVKNITTDIEIANMTTNYTGFYRFTDLPNGTFNVTEELKSGWENVSEIYRFIVINGQDESNVNFTNKQTILDEDAPVWSPNPVNQIIELGSIFSYTVHAIDQQTITYSINDSSNFVINSVTGMITNKVSLNRGIHWLIITATDASGNSNSTKIAIIVHAPVPDAKDGHDELIITTQDNPLQGSIINPTVYTGYGLLFDDKYGRLWARTTTKKDLYMYNGTWNKMYTFTDSSIYSAYYTDKDILLVSIRYTSNKSGTLMRSTDNATTFSTVLTFTNDTYQAPWSYGSIGNKIVIGEYGTQTITGQTKNVWLSTDNGATWNKIYSTNSSQSGNHIHQVGIDNTAIYVAHGDTYKDAVRSIDNGATWNHFGITDQYTSMAFADNFILFGDDPEPKFVATSDISSSILAELPYPWTNFIERLIYVNGVFYAIQSGQLTFPDQTGLWISTNGRDWYLIYNLTNVQGTFSEVSNDANNFTWGALSYYSGLWKNRLLTVDEANELIYGNLLNRTLADEPQYFSFYSKPLTNANITIYGRTVKNLVSNPSFENNFNDWKSTLVSPDNYNIDNIISHSGGKSVHIITNGAGSRGKIYQTVFDDSVTPLPTGTTITWSGWIRLNSVTENSYSVSPYDPSVVIGVSIKYKDGTSFTDRNTKVRVNTGEKWVRFSITKTFSKPVQQISSEINFYQKLEGWVDDVQVQIGELSPYINGSANTSGTLTLNGESITIPDLGSGQRMTMDLVNDLTGFVTVIPNLEGNKIVTIKIDGAEINPGSQSLIIKNNKYSKNKAKSQRIVPNNISNDPIPMENKDEYNLRYD